METIEAQDNYKNWNAPGWRAMDLATLKEQVERCRRLAKTADPFTEQRLLDLAREYEAQIASLEAVPSLATEKLKRGDPS